MVSNWSSTRQKIGICLLFVFLLALVIANPLSYYCQPIIPRIIIILTFVSFFVFIFFITRSSQTNNKLLWLLFFALVTAFFLTWRSSFFTSFYSISNVNSQMALFSKQYIDTGNILFSVPHSYFFSTSLLLSSLCLLGGFSTTLGIYVLLCIFGIIIITISFLLFIFLRNHLSPESGFIAQLIPPLVGFSLISFACCERTSAINTSVLLALLALSFFAATKLETRNNIVLLILFTIGVTLGSADGIMLFVSGFIIFALFEKRYTAILFALIPLSYMVFSAYSYVSSLSTYVRVASKGFSTFFTNLLQGNPTSRVVPWARVSGSGLSDRYVASIAYIALFALSALTIFIIFLLLRNKKKIDKGFSHSGLVWFALWTGLAALVYIGASAVTETSSSDIRTIPIVLMSLILPFLFLSTNIIKNISKHKKIMVCLVILLMLASVRTVYEINTKSIDDPISTVEDNRLGITNVYSAKDFILTYYPAGGIVADYRVLIKLDNYFDGPQYISKIMGNESLRDDAKFHDIFDIYPPTQVILVYSTIGSEYSLYHSPQDYQNALNFTSVNNRIYDDGLESISIPFK